MSGPLPKPAYPPRRKERSESEGSSKRLPLSPAMAKAGLNGQFTMLCYYELNPDDHRMNTFGIPFNELKKMDIKMKKRLADHRTEVSGTLRKEDPKLVTFALVKFSTYVDDDQSVYIPAEIGITAFSVNGGIIDNFSTFIDVCEIPTGHGFAARDNCQKLRVPYPPFDNRLQNYKVLAQRMERFVQHNSFPATRKLKLYCMPGDMKEVFGCFKWIYNQFDGECPFEVFSFTEAMLMLTTAISDIQLPKYGDRLTLNERLLAARLSRDAAGEELSSRRSISSGYLYESSEYHASKVKQPVSVVKPGVWGREQNSNNDASASLAGGGRGGGHVRGQFPHRGGRGHGAYHDHHEAQITSDSSLPMSSLPKLAPTKNTKNKGVLFPYSASIASSSKAMRPPGTNVEDWNKIRAGCFSHERQVQDYLGSFDLAFEPVLSCLLHMDPEAEESMPFCPLNVTNRSAYNMLDVLTPIAEVMQQLTIHVPAIGPVAEIEEVRRREQLLRNWVLLVRSAREFKYDDKVQPPYPRKVKESTGIPR